MRELPELEGDCQEPTTSESDTEKPKNLLHVINIEANFDNKDREILSKMSYPRPNDFFETNTGRLKETHDEVKNDVKVYTGQIAGLKRKKQQQKNSTRKKAIEVFQMPKKYIK